MKFDEKSEAKGYLETIGQDLYGEILESFDTMELSTIDKYSLFQIEANPHNPPDPTTIKKEIVHKMVREGMYWQYYVKRGTQWMKA